MEQLVYIPLDVWMAITLGGLFTSIVVTFPLLFALAAYNYSEEVKQSYNPEEVPGLCWTKFLLLTTVWVGSIIGLQQLITRFIPG